MGAIVFTLGIAVLFQFIIIREKYHRGMYADIGVDVGMLVLLNIIFGGSILGVVSATAGSTFISLYLMWKPVKLVTPKIFEGSSPNNNKPKDYKSPAERMAEGIDSLFT